MRLGGAILNSFQNPEEWLVQIKELNYSAVVFPLKADASAEEKADYVKYARENDIVIGEVGVWRNSMSLNAEEKKQAIYHAVNQLAMADEIGAKCCVNVCGSCSSIWDSYHPDNYTLDTYAKIVDTTREIIDAVNPKRTFFTLEPMPWMCPDSPEQYLKLVKDVDRKAFGVHLDYTNMINSIERYHNSSQFVKHCFQLLGPYIKSIHIKDIHLENVYPCSMKEIVPGRGEIDLGLVMRLAHALGDDMTVYTEHLASHGEYLEAIAYLRGKAKELGVWVK